MPELEAAHAKSCTVYRLPGRDWYYLLGPQNSQARNLAFGLAEFPGGRWPRPIRTRQRRRSSTSSPAKARSRRRQGSPPRARRGRVHSAWSRAPNPRGGVGAVEIGDALLAAGRARRVRSRGESKKWVSERLRVVPPW